MMLQHDSWAWPDVLQENKVTLWADIKQTYPHMDNHTRESDTEVWMLAESGLFATVGSCEICAGV